MSPKNSTSTQSRKGPIPPRSLAKQHSDPTSNMANPKSKVSEVDPGVSSRKRQAPETSTSTKKKHKVDLASQGANRNLTEVTRGDTPGFEEFYERENRSYFIDEEDDEDGLDLEDNHNIDSTFQAAVFWNTVKSKADPTITRNSNQNNLSTFRYSQLKCMSTEPVPLAHYNAEGPLAAHMRSGFDRMPLEKLEDLPRDKFPKKYHEILDEVIREKTFEMMNELGIPGPRSR